MAEAAQSQSRSGRSLAQARRRALARAGKAALKGQGGTPNGAGTPGVSSTAAAGASPGSATASSAGGREAARARRRAMAARGKAALGQSVDSARPRRRPQGAGSNPSPDAPGATSDKNCSCGCKERQRTAGQAAVLQPAAGAPPAKPAPRIAEGRRRSMARRRAMAAAGKAGLQQLGGNAPASNADPNANGREAARQMRRARAGKGRAEQAPQGGRSADESSQGTTHTTEVHASGNTSRTPNKVEVSETSGGQKVTGRVVGHTSRITGDEPGTCKRVTGTEYLGAETLREFCDSHGLTGPAKVGTSKTLGGLPVSGALVGRSARVTGDEPGTCKRVTGTEYVGAEQFGAFCGSDLPLTNSTNARRRSRSEGGRPVTGDAAGRSPAVTGDEAGAGRRPSGMQYAPSEPAEGPVKVGVTRTGGGRVVTGSRVGRSARVTGDEPGSCKNVTGNEYLPADEFQQVCKTEPYVAPPKVDTGFTWRSNAVTGTRFGRGPRVTGNEPGTCKDVTGTPYIGPDQQEPFCEPEGVARTAARQAQRRSTPGPSITGQQPVIGAPLTGTERGACEPLTGTPYVGAEHYAAVCGPTHAAEPGDPDFPISMAPQPWQGFSIMSPARAAHVRQAQRTITGTRYEHGRRITGPFSVADEVVTGTESFRFGEAMQRPDAWLQGRVPEPDPAAARVDAQPRITGEGMDTGLRITGDDWARGNRVTGTEGSSATRRNPTRRGRPGAAFAGAHVFRDGERADVPMSPVTGSSGNTERGATVTVSGGARG